MSLDGGPYTYPQTDGTYMEVEYRGTGEKQEEKLPDEGIENVEEIPQQKVTVN